MSTLLRTVSEVVFFFFVCFEGFEEKSVCFVIVNRERYRRAIKNRIIRMI